MRDIPDAVRIAAFDPLQLRQIKDRDENWTGGCTAGVHFLEAGETATGWWVCYEAGGIVNIRRVVVLERINGEFKIIGEKSAP